jgi:hypothetical protein
LTNMITHSSLVTSTSDSPLIILKYASPSMIISPCSNRIANLKHIHSLKNFSVMMNSFNINQLIDSSPPSLNLISNSHQLTSMIRVHRSLIPLRNSVLPPTQIEFLSTLLNANTLRISITSAENFSSQTIGIIPNTTTNLLLTIILLIFY